MRFEVGDEILRFEVVGRPQTQGSKIVRQIKGMHIPVEDNPDLKPWRSRVAKCAASALRSRYRGRFELIDAPLVMRTVFYLNRPKSHFSSSAAKPCETVPSAPTFPVTKPDVFKMQRAIEDALTGVVYVDDSRIVKGIAEKSYGKPEGVWIGIYLAAELKGGEPWLIPSMNSMLKKWSRSPMKNG
jgi:Holliday junction resolvase RusA-like endonuclease